MQASKTNEIPQIVHKGPEAVITLPSKNKVTIREQTGDDEEILSRATSEKGANVLAYLASVIIHDEELGRKPLTTDVGLYQPNDINYLLFKCRRHNLGDDFKFEHTCENPECGCTQNYLEDLKIFDGDLFSKDYKPHRFGVRANPSGNIKSLEFTLASGKQLRMNILSQTAQTTALDMPADKRTVMQNFYARNLEMLYNDQWIEVTSFMGFGPKETTELRNILKNSDILNEFAPLAHIVCPECKTPDYINILLHSDFFFPTEI